MLKHLTCLSALLLATGAFAQQNEGSGAGAALFDRFDTNMDGRISQEEAETNQTLSTNFGTADANKDGYLTRQEFVATFDEQRRSESNE